MNPEEYTVEELVLNQNFIRWVKYPQTEDGSHWITWAASNTANEATIREASLIVLKLADDNDDPFEEELTELWNRINFTNAINEGKPSGKNKIFVRLLSLKYHAAAVIAFFIISILLIFLLKASREEFHTAYGNSRRVVLPDSSVVVMNGNSTIKYAASWKDKEREVWFEGEGFFSVSHKSDSRKFIVHTPDLDVQVMGTKFNVNTYRQRTRVVLNSGKVKLHMENMFMEMDPGDLVDFSATTKKIIKKIVSPPKYSAWTNRKFVFEDTSLEEIARLLEDNYGYKVSFSDSSLGRLTFTGTFDSENTDLLLTMIEKSFGLTVQKNGKQVMINH